MAGLSGICCCSNEAIHGLNLTLLKSVSSISASENDFGSGSRDRCFDFSYKKSNLLNYPWLLEVDAERTSTMLESLIAQDFLYPLSSRR